MLCFSSISYGLSGKIKKILLFSNIYRFFNKISGSVLQRQIAGSLYLPRSFLQIFAVSFVTISYSTIPYNAVFLLLCSFPLFATLKVIHVLSFDLRCSSFFSPCSSIHLCSRFPFYSFLLPFVRKIS